MLVLGHLPYSHPTPDLNSYLILLLFSCGTGCHALFSATLSALAPHSSGKMEKSGVKFSWIWIIPLEGRGRIKIKRHVRAQVLACFAAVEKGSWEEVEWNEAGAVSIGLFTKITVVKHPLSTLSQLSGISIYFPSISVSVSLGGYRSNSSWIT